MVIDGKEIAEKIIKKLKKWTTERQIKKFLAVFVVEDELPSFSFIRQKKKVAEKLNIDFRVYKFPKEIKQDELRKKIVRLGKHKTCGGIIVQLPLPGHINKNYVLNAIKREKDVDVLSERALGAFYTNRNPVSPPAVEVLKEILKVKKIPICRLSPEEKIKNCKIAVVGLGFLVGKPIAVWLSGRCSDLILLDQGGDLGLLKEADIVICGTGIPELIKPEMLKEDVLIIDFGYSMKNRKITGDFLKPTTGNQQSATVFYTPTPGGTGPILVAKLFENFYMLNK